MALSFYFHQLDSWFFKESKPMESVGGTELNSLFPPSAMTLAGSVRTLIGDVLGVDWHAYQMANEQAASQLNTINLEDLLGDGEHCGRLQFTHPYLEVYSQDFGWQRLYPMPADILELKEPKNTYIKLDLPLEPVQCDLGRVRLPQLPKAPQGQSYMGAKPLENAWLLPQGWQAYCDGEVILPEQVVKMADLIVLESRLGIGRDNHTATVKDGLLYQTQHIRFNLSRFSDIRIVTQVQGIDEQLQDQFVGSHSVRFGGEGRIAFVEVEISKPSIPEALPQTNKIKMVFNSPVYFSNNKQGLPKNAEKISLENHDVYAFLGMQLQAQISYKPIQIGGWDLLKHQPKPLRSFLPAGTCWYVEATDLVHKKIGELTAFGYGEVSYLPWNDLNN